MSAKGSKPALMIASTKPPRVSEPHVRIGPTPSTPTIARTAPRIPAEKLFTSISKPDGIRSSNVSSNFLISQPPIGPAIIAPRNIGTLAPTTTPMVATAPRTPPRWPYTSLPPVYPISSGIMYVIIGPTSLARVSFGVHPVGMTNAVIRPHARMAPMLGRTIAAR